MHEIIVVHAVEKYKNDVGDLTNPNLLKTVLIWCFKQLYVDLQYTRAQIFSVLF